MHLSRRALALLGALTLSLAACDSDPDVDGGVDAGARDAGSSSDAGSSDAGPSDAGTSPDDAGSAEDDAGAPDAGSLDAGADDDAGASDAGVSDAGSDAGPADAGTCSPALVVLDDGTGASGAVGLPSLVISEIDPGSFIELFNTTGADIALSGSSMQLCSPFSYAALSSLAGGVTVPAGGYAELPWPSTFSDVDAGGEVILYASGSFGADTAILDFVCWGTDPHGTRMSQAVAVGKWVGPCAAAIGAGDSLVRVTATTGTNAASYSTATPTPETCAP